MKKYIYATMLLAMTIMASCKREYLDINENPNQAVSSTALLVLPTALNTTANRLAHNEIGAFWGGQWSPTTNVAGFNPERTYNAQPATAFTINIWNGCYDNLGDYDFVEKDANSKGLKLVEGIAQVMKVFNFQLLTDAYGDIPYKQALQAANGISTPTYDSAKDVIYPDLIVKLDIAIKNLSVPVKGDNASISQEDIYFAGSPLQWIRFANTLKLRILLRQSEIQDKQTYISAEIAKIVNDGALNALLGGKFFLGIYDDVKSNPGFLQTANKQNPFWNNYAYTEAGANAANQAFYAISQYALNKIENNSGGPRDLQRITRMTTFATKAYTTGLIGVPFGVNGGTIYGYDFVSKFGVGLLDKFNQPMLVMTASEALMLQAEAVVKGYLVGDYKTLFKNAVRSSFALLKAGATPLSNGTISNTTPANSLPVYTDWNQIAEDVDYDIVDISSLPKRISFEATLAQSENAANSYMTYGLNSTTIANIDTAPDNTEALRRIMEQKFICLYGFSGFEVWCDVRKYQNLDGSSPSTLLNVPKALSSQFASDKRPLRLPYPIGEQQVNNVNLQAAKTRQGVDGDIVTGKLFWDVK